MQFQRTVPTSPNNLLTSLDIQRLRDEFRTSDDRGDRITIGTALYPQFSFSHHAFDSKVVKHVGGEYTEDRTEAENRYDFKENGTGVYGKGDGAGSILHHSDGTFKFDGDKLPQIKWTGKDGEEETGELAADMDRANENPNLRLWHRIWSRYHNRRQRDGSNFELAKAETVSAMCLASLEQGAELVGCEPSEVINGVLFDKMHLDVCFNFGIARIPHALITDTVQGFDLQADYEPVPSQLFDGSEYARVLDLGVSNAMRDMTVPAGSPDIVERTTGRHNELNLPVWSDLWEHYNGDSDLSAEIGRCPVWFGALKQCELFSDDPHEFDPLVARMYLDGLAGTLEWGKSHSEGIYREPWKGAPSTLAEMIEYAQG